MADTTRVVLLETKTKGVTEATKEYTALADAENEAVKESDDLAESQQDLAGAFDNVEGPLGNVVKGVQGAITGFTNLLKSAGPLVIALTAIAAVAAAIGLAFSKSKKLNDEFRRSSAA